MRKLWPPAVFLVQCIAWTSEPITIADITDQEVASLIQNLNDSKFIYEVFAGESPGTVENSGAFEVATSLDSKRNEFMLRITHDNDDGSGNALTTTSYIIFNSVAPFEFKRAGKSNSYKTNGKLSSFESVRVEVRGGKLVRTKTTQAEDKTMNTSQSEHKYDPLKLNAKTTFADMLFARKKLAVGSELSVIKSDDDNISSVDDEKFSRSLADSETTFRVIDKKNNAISLSKTFTDSEGFLDKEVTQYNDSGIPSHQIVNDANPYVEVIISEAIERKSISIKPDFNLKLEIPLPNETHDNKVSEQLKSGKMVFQIAEGSKDPPLGHDQLVQGGEIILQKNVGVEAISKQPVLASDISHSSDNLIPQDLFDAVQSEVKAKPSLKEDAFRLIKVIQRAVHSKIKYQKATGDFTLQDVFRMGKGDCNNMATIYAAILRRLGIPAHVAFGFYYSPNDVTATSHAWVEARFGDKWIGIEATDSFSADYFLDNTKAIYFKLASGPSSSSLEDIVELTKQINGLRLNIHEKAEARKQPH